AHRRYPARPAPRRFLPPDMCGANCASARGPRDSRWAPEAEPARPPALQKPCRFACGPAHHLANSAVAWGRRPWLARLGGHADALAGHEENLIGARWAVRLGC